MASHLRRLVFNTRERLLSTDLNDQITLVHRALIEGIASALHGDTQQIGVVRGFTVSVPGGSLNVSVAPGLAMRLGTPATSYDHAVEWLELRSAQSVDLSSYVDGANPRWVCIEVSANDAAEVTSLRDIFLPASGTFTPVSVDKVRGSSPTITVTAGTAAAVPKFPAGTAGRIPLAYVYIPAAAATLTVGDVVHCRPIAKGGGHLDAFRSNVRDVQGGGVSVASAGTTVALRQCTGRFDQHHVPFGIAATSLAVPAGGWDTGAVPGVDDVAYFYAIPAPYPSGYDATLAPREFRPEASAASRFPAMVTVDMADCIVIASTAEPNPDTLQGAPTSGNFSIAAAAGPWGSLTVSVARSRGVYLGAAFFDAGPNQFVAQIERSGWTWPTAAPGIPSVNIHDATVFVPAPASSINIWGGILPVTAQEVRCALVVAGGTATSARIGFTDLTTNATGSGSHVGAWAGGVPTVAEYEFVAYPDASGNITFVSGAVTAATTDLGGADLRSMAYRDSILARR